MKALFPILFFCFINTCIAQQSYTGIATLKTQSPETLVEDYAELFSKYEKTFLLQKLINYRDSTSTAIQIVTVPNLEGKEIQNVSLAIANSWGFTDKRKKNGILILIAKEDRQIRMELGKGIVEHITSKDANRILFEQFRPFAKKEQYYEGLDEVTTTIIAMLSGQYKEGFRYPTVKSASTMGIYTFFVFIFLWLGYKEFPHRWLLLLLGGTWVVGLVYIVLYINQDSQVNYIFRVAGIMLVEFICANILISKMEDKETQRYNTKIIKACKSYIEEQIPILKAAYAQYINMDAAHQWEQKIKAELLEDKSRIELYKSRRDFHQGKYFFRYKKEEIECRVKALADLKVMFDFFEDEKKWSKSINFYPAQLMEIYRARLREKFLVIKPSANPKSISYYSSKHTYDYGFPHLFPITNLIELPLFEKIISPQDLELNEIKSWLKKLFETKRLIRINNYPVLITTKKEEKKEKKFLREKEAEAESAENAEQIYTILLDMLRHWRPKRISKSTSSSNSSSSKTSYNTTPYKPKNNTSSTSYNDNNDYDYGSDDSFGGDGADITW